MSKAEILAELPKLSAQERGEIIEQLGRLENAAGPSESEKSLLNEAPAAYDAHPNAGAACSGATAVLPLDKMTVEEKLHAMEALWADLSRHADAFASPAWHGDVLRERDRRMADGNEPSADWDDAKHRLRERLL
jgi:hypothetical protein